MGTAPGRLIAVTAHERGRRLHVLSRRTHHGDFGALAILVGLAAMWRDRADRADWFRFRRELGR